MKICKKGAAFAVVLMLSALAAGCAAGDTDGQEDEQKAIIDDYAEIILVQDGDSAEFDAALKAAADYLDGGGQEDAVKRIESAIQKLEEESASYEEYEVSEELAALLEKQGISMVEYQMNANARYDSLQNFLYDLECLQFYVEYAAYDESFWQDLETVYRLMEQEQEQICAYSYTGVNYWFAGWGSEAEEYVKAQVLDKFESFAAEDAVWYDSRSAVEARMNTYLDRIEEINGEWAAFVGSSQEELNQLKEDAIKESGQ